MNISRTFTSLFLMAVIITTGYLYKEEWSNFLFPPKPCEDVIYYKINEFDQRFNITKDKLIAELKESEGAWEDSISKNLFEYSATGTLAINLIYDDRQQTTQKLNNVGNLIEADQSTYDELKSRFDFLSDDYNKKKENYEIEIKEYEIKRKEHEDRVNYWNDQGGAPPKEFRELSQEQEELNRRQNDLASKYKELSKIVSEVNTMARELNEVAGKLNLKVNTFNTIGKGSQEEFNEGEYVFDKNGTRINIYQFENIPQLRRLLVHEFGHALGLEHVSNEESIMYRLNSSTNQKLTKEDEAELRRICIDQN